MSEELLSREKEFRELNARIDSHARRLMCQADTLMNGQREPDDGTPPPPPTREVDSRDISPQPGHRQPPLEHFLRSRLNILQQDLDTVKMKYRTTIHEMKQLEIEYEKVQEDRNKWKRTAELNKEQKERLSNQLTAFQSQLQIKDTQITNLKRENDGLKREYKNVHNCTAHQDVRLNKALEELERTRTNLQEAKRAEKDLRDRHRRDVSDMTAINRRLDKHTMELTSAFRKQLLLIDNLKKQKMYLESAKITDMTEEDFVKILDWKPDKVSQ